MKYNALSHADRETRFTMEAMEARRMLSITLMAGDLVVTGTNRHDQIEVTASPERVTVSLNGEFASFAHEEVYSITLDGGRGHDVLRVNDPDGYLWVGVTLYGGD